MGKNRKLNRKSTWIDNNPPKVSAANPPKVSAANPPKIDGAAKMESDLALGLETLVQKATFNLKSFALHKIKVPVASCVFVNNLDEIHVINNSGATTVKKHISGGFSYKEKLYPSLIALCDELDISVYPVSYEEAKYLKNHPNIPTVKNVGIYVVSNGFICFHHYPKYYEHDFPETILVAWTGASWLAVDHFPADPYFENEKSLGDYMRYIYNL